jgi:membrane fusion protein, multidrug efflux system
MSNKNESETGSSPFKIKASIVWGGVFALVIAAWLFSGVLDGTPRKELENAKPLVEASASNLTSVRVRTIEAVPHEVELSVRGRTEALRSVQIRAETAGRIVALPAEKGTFVREGDVLCEISVDAREAQVREAQALLRQRKLEWDAAKRLQQQGHRSETQTAAIQAGYRSAQANAQRMEIELARTKIRAPYPGIFNDRKVEIGDYMQPGQVCGTVVSQDPFLVVGQVSERDVSRLHQGDSGTARLLSGEIVTGTIRYISAGADPATRTFKIELEVSNPSIMAMFEKKTEEGASQTKAKEVENDAPIAKALPVTTKTSMQTEAPTIFRDGITAELYFPLGKAPAHHISPAVLGLNTQGEVIVRIVDDEDTVSFVKVQIISDTITGVWVTGLPPVANIITVGQELVMPGEKVLPVKDQKIAAN